MSRDDGQRAAANRLADLGADGPRRGPVIRTLDFVTPRQRELDSGWSRSTDAIRFARDRLLQDIAEAEISVSEPAERPLHERVAEKLGRLAPRTADTAPHHPSAPLAPDQAVRTSHARRLLLQSDPVLLSDNWEAEPFEDMSGEGETLFRTIRHNWLVLAGLAVGFAALLAIGLQALPKKYSAATTLFVDVPQASQPAAASGIAAAATGLDEIDKVAKRFVDPANLAGVARTLGLSPDTDLAPLVRLERDANSALLRIIVTSDDATQSAMIANAIPSSLVEERKETAAAPVIESTAGGGTGMDAVNPTIRVVTPAAAPDRADGPGRLTLGLAAAFTGALLGLLAGLCYCVLRLVLSVRSRSADQG